MEQKQYTVIHLVNKLAIYQGVWARQFEQDQGEAIYKWNDLHHLFQEIRALMHAFDLFPNDIYPQPNIYDSWHCYRFLSEQISAVLNLEVDVPKLTSYELHHYVLAFLQSVYTKFPEESNAAWKSITTLETREPEEAELHKYLVVKSVYLCCMGLKINVPMAVNESYKAAGSLESALLYNMVLINDFMFNISDAFKEIDSIMSLILDPEERSYTREDLVVNFNFPAHDYVPKQ